MVDLDFVMVGRVSQEGKQYLAIANSLPNVKFLGHQQRRVVRDLMAEAEALIFPSEVEGLPLTVLEALAMGLPVLAQPKSSLPEVVIPNRTGWLLNDSNLEEWEYILRQILKWDIYQRKKFESQATQFVKENYSWDIIAERYANLYNEVVARSTR